MNPTEIFQFLTSLFRDHGPEVFVAFILGAAGAIWLLWQCGFLATRELIRKGAELEGNLKVAEEQKKIAEIKLSQTSDQMQQTMSELAQTRDQLHQTKTELDNRIKLADRYRNERNQARTQLQEAQANSAKLEEELNVARQATAQLTADLSAAKEQAAAWAAERARRGQTIADLTQAGTDLELKLGQSVAEVEGLKTTVQKREEERIQVGRRYARKCRQLRELHKSLGSVVAEGGKVWERPLPPDAPRFIPLGEERRCPIISVLNLKGGVGKTTIALNLAATLSDKGKRVLLVDCDHQRSLTNLCVRPSRRNELHDLGKTLQQYLVGPDRDPEAFMRCVHPLPNMERCSIVINTAAHDGTGGLANVEETLMIEWLVQPTQLFDIRLALCAALHALAVSRQFEFVILDCPPRLTTACINSLVASDYVLIPVLLDAISATSPLPHLLSQLRRLRSSPVFPHFNILGILANRLATRLTGVQAQVWENLNGLTSGAWGEPVHRFGTMIKQAVAYTRAARILASETETAVAVWDDEEAKQTFQNLAEEILQRISHETPNLATVSS